MTLVLEADDAPTVVSVLRGRVCAVEGPDGQIGEAHGFAVFRHNGEEVVGCTAELEQEAGDWDGCTVAGFAILGTIGDEE